MQKGRILRWIDEASVVVEAPVHSMANLVSESRAFLDTQDLANYVELARTRTFEIYESGKVEVLLVRISAVPDWDEKLQKSIRTDMMTAEEWESFASPPEDLSHLPESYDDWSGEAD